MFITVFIKFRHFSQSSTILIFPYTFDFFKLHFNIILPSTIKSIIYINVCMFLYNNVSKAFISQSQCNYLYRCTVYFVVYLSNTPTNAHI